MRLLRRCGGRASSATCTCNGPRCAHGVWQSNASQSTLHPPDPFATVTHTEFVFRCESLKPRRRQPSSPLRPGVHCMEPRARTQTQCASLLGRERRRGVGSSPPPRRSPPWQCCTTTNYRSSPTTGDRNRGQVHHRKRARGRLKRTYLTAVAAAHVYEFACACQRQGHRPSSSHRCLELSLPPPRAREFAPPDVRPLARFRHP